jgi:hypothetical protein
MSTTEPDPEPEVPTDTEGTGVADAGNTEALEESEKDDDD